MSSKFVLAAPFNNDVLNIAARYNIEHTIANGQIFLFIDDAVLLVTIAEEIKRLDDKP